MLRYIALILRGAVIAQIIGFFALPFLTRIFDAEAFGRLQYYQSLLVIFGVLPNLRFDFAVLRSEDGEETAALFALCLLSNLVVTCALTTGLWVWRAISPETQAVYLPFEWWLLPTGVALYGLMQAAGNLSLRRFAYRINSDSKVIQSLSNAGSAIGIGKIGFSDTGLIVADIVGRAGASAFLLLNTLRRPLARIDKSAVTSAAKRYRAFPLVSTPSGIINATGGALTPIMVFSVFSAETAGQYGLVDRSLNLALAMIVVSVSQVYASQLGERVREGRDLRVFFSRLILTLAGWALIPTILAAYFAPSLFPIIFGAEWAEAGHFARYIVPALFFLLLSGAVNMTLVVLERQGRQMIWEPQGCVPW